MLKWFKKRNEQTIISKNSRFSVRLDRDSVCMGDDATDHRVTREFPQDMTVSQLLKQLVEYIPRMNNTVWLILGEGETLGYITFDAKGNAELEVEGADGPLIKRFFSVDLPLVTCLYYYRSKFSWIDEAPGDSLLEKVKAAQKERSRNRTSRPL
ncbi:hypothetical protein I6N96_07050 [Enterococcus sp. BWM-S5]|uniref:DUF3846 domain-containing protein n=1 Tax=Enterococcus larvae TaxID=2794352 RepID=A0ABS4CHD8_9ENTE|nr:hypothetical protein [Enterococcus larvae]MBP1046035.1 hypothetical protein [Enterococcus larvae]